MQLDRILFLDIETVSQHCEYGDCEEDHRKLWDEKAAHLARNEETPEEMYERAGIYAEFGKIICISVGIIREKSGQRELRLKSFCGDDEAQLLSEFSGLLEQYFNTSNHCLCAHNGKEFDFPYIARRMLINRLPVPSLLDTAGKKPWEVQHLDTMHLWRFGDYKNFTSLKLLAHVFGLPTPKDDIDGSQVGRVYWQEKNLQRIVSYCEKDVATLVNVYLAMQNLPAITPSEITN